VSGRRLSTYTVGHGGREDERPSARETASALGTDHHEVSLSEPPRQLVAEGIQAMDEPIADGAFFATLQLAKVTARDFKVVLTGEGSDEIFGGYGHYVREARWGWIFDAPVALRRTARKGMTATARCLRWPRLGELARHLGTEADRSGGRWAQAWALESALALLDDKARDEVVERYDGLFPARAFAATARSISRRPARAQWLDQVTLLPNYLLQKIDRATMAYGLEARTPFLDHRLAETLARYPWASWAAPVGEKPLLRRIAARYLPPRVVNRPKAGFSAPTRQWVEALAAEGVLGDDASRVVVSALSEYEAKKLWVFAVLRLWLERWGAAHVIARLP
jgi:asparagine synthase (glutamine-hydrolysing)